VIADNCAEYANLIFENSQNYNGSTLVLGSLFFTFQIYGDFSGYSDIAIGTSRLFGFNLKKNFSFPYFSRDIAEFWRRWHISLSSWFRDYLYIPLGGSRGGTWMKIRNTFIIFIVSGFWHGANWTFIVWGALNALYFLPLLLLNKNRVNTNIIAQGKKLPTVKEFLNMIITFSLTLLAWIFFRATDLNHAFRYLSEIFSESIFSTPDFGPGRGTFLTIALTSIFIILEWIGREDEHALEKLGFQWKRPVRLIIYYCLILAIFFLGGKEVDFIYFQF
jgi:D-alanyl-lipoteichoic acid acyltransferase DltB (MBOAT superfamily)